MTGITRNLIDSVGASTEEHDTLRPTVKLVAQKLCYARPVLRSRALVCWGIVRYLLSSVLFLFVTFALYRLLEGVDQRLAQLMVILGGFMVTPLFFVNAVTDVGALQLARGADFLSVFDKPQRDAFTVLFLNLHHHLDLADAIFWGIWLIPFGLLVYRSRFLPPVLGVWLIVGCLGYLGFSLAGFLLPKYEDIAFTMGTPFRMGELAIMFWLVIVGASEKRLAVAES